MTTTPEDRDRNTGLAADGGIQKIVVLTFLALLVLGCGLVMLPFLSAIVWAIILSFSSWGIFCRIRSLLGDRPTLAALVMTLGLAAIVVAPFVLVGNSLADNVSDVIVLVRNSFGSGPRQPPQWIGEIPVVGPHLSEYIAHLANDAAARGAAMHQLIQPLKTFALGLGKALGHGVLEISLSLLVGFFLYRDGDGAAARLETSAFRLAGARGARLLEVARATVKGVVHGILGTSLMQGVLGGIGFWIAGVPGVFLLGFATFILSFVPLATAILWIPAVGWLYAQGATGWAIFLVVWSVVIGGLIDHVIKPMIIARTGGTPFLIVLFGVIGGAIAFGFIGVFIGPTLLAVGYRLIEEWSSDLMP
ncbi:MAG: AI-2E family transporter [Candidatus Binataceae bacterium]|nr:AI-2E family transporter [Candidatus Binataceae bacterium]